MGLIMSKVGRLPGSSFMQMRISLAMCGLRPGGMDTRSPSRAICKKKTTTESSKSHFAFIGYVFKIRLEESFR